MKKSIFKENRRYTFSDYFDMASPTREIVGELGYSFAVELIDLPRLPVSDPAIVRRLNAIYYTAFPKISLTSEIAKREFLIAPLLLEMAMNFDIRIEVEYPLDIDDKLSGSLDYLLRWRHSMLVIEAKKKDMDGGFNQLAAELIALDKYEENDTAGLLYGAVTLGDIWKFGVLDRQRKRIVKNIPSHTLPHDTEEIFSILMGIIGAA